MHWRFDAADPRSVGNARRLLLAYLRTRGRPDADYEAAELVVGELLGNAVRHAPGTVVVEIEWRRKVPVLHVLDRGPGYELAADLPSASSESGRGLFLVSELAREFTVTPRCGRGTHARAVLPVERRSSRLSGILWFDRSEMRSPSPRLRQGVGATYQDVTTALD
jgi:anti-sigma regulatory factor (Ser/Thr protein kinase)